MKFILHSANSINASLSQTGNSHMKLIPFSLFFFFLPPFNKWDSSMNSSSYFIFYSQIYFKSLMGLIKNFYFSFLRSVQFRKCLLSRSFKKEMVRKTFPHSYLLSPFSLLPSFFLCIFPFVFSFILLKDLINMHDCSSLRKEKVEKYCF